MKNTTPFDDETLQKLCKHCAKHGMTPEETNQIFTDIFRVRDELAADREQFITQFLTDWAMLPERLQRNATTFETDPASVLSELSIFEMMWVFSPGTIAFYAPLTGQLTPEETEEFHQLAEVALNAWNGFLDVVDACLGNGEQLVHVRNAIPVLANCVRNIIDGEETCFLREYIKAHDVVSGGLLAIGKEVAK